MLKLWFHGHFMIEENFVLHPYCVCMHVLGSLFQQQSLHFLLLFTY